MQPVVFLLRYLDQKSEGSHPAALSRILVTPIPGSREPGERFHVGGEFESPAYA